MTDQMTEPTTSLDERPASSWTFVPEEPEANEVVVRRNGLLSLVMAGVSALVSAAYFARAATATGGATFDWLVCLALAALTWAFVFSFLDSRMPLVVADSHGIRIRLGRTWRGMAWGDLEEVEHLPRRGFWRDGRLTAFPLEVDGELALLGPAGQRHARLTDKMFGAPFAVPLGMTTRVLGAEGDLTGALAALARGRCEVVEVVRGATEDEVEGEAEMVDEAPEGVADPDATGEMSAVEPEPSEERAKAETPEAPEDTVPVMVASPTPDPLRDLRTAVRAEATREPAHQSDQHLATREEDPELTQSMPVPAIPGATSTFVIGELADVPVVHPVIGPELTAARERLRLSVDQLAERTRIRPHVIEAIEIDDFVPCGGDFYARGHLRTLARVLGVDVTPLLASYDERYSQAPIDPRRVFESELATGRHGPIRGTRGGPNWSVIVAAVMTVVLAWSVARLVMDHPGAVSPSSPSLADGSAGLTSGSSKAAAPVPVVVSAAGGGARVVLRDGTGKVVFTGSLAFGQSKTFQVSPPVRIQSSDGSTEVTVDGQEHGALGKTGEPAQDVFTVR